MYGVFPYGVPYYGQTVSEAEPLELGVVSGYDRVFAYAEGGQAPSSAGSTSSVADATGEPRSIASAQSTSRDAPSAVADVHDEEGSP